ncbi:MAG: Holliday junction resolvase [Methanospirillum sp.]|uniref:Holliday junction resolvase-like protein n=1 Tax=Methanospirillum sp. TaxID=45200 RepID=UPI00236DAA53|nr:Holliday junction resolvase-like protein [Methanospirillum sp.]MDD1728168.1 Holliday junction resolvase [Methanospirillum sp.]
MDYEFFIILILTVLIIWIGICYIRLKTSLEERARVMHAHWRDHDLVSFQSRIKEQAEDTIRRETDLQTRKWQNEEEQKIRRDAIRRSREVIHGKVTEHMIPFFPSFPWNPSDARFLGSPIDFIVFDGLSEGEVREIILVEVKSGIKKVLTPRERSVERCISRGEVSFRVLHPEDLKSSGPDQNKRSRIW